ncbi:MAG: methionyl-tRNA formyltransferase [Candidatus Omnitrophica bacterium]|nr:methionyl-tRNA formyltransferase [Candidatus Omnitrophota bacterium]
MKIIFFGSSDFSIPVLESLLSSKHSVILVITTPDQKKGRGQVLAPSVVKAFARQRYLTVEAPRKLSLPDVVQDIKKLNPDLIVIASYGKIVPSAIFMTPRIAALNVHPSLLPRHRGASPIQQAILEGDKKTGVSVAEVTSELDAGDLLGQVEIEIDKNENALELSKRLAEMGAKLLLQTLGQLEAGKINKIKQDVSKATYAKKLNKNDGQIDWATPASYIHNQVRAYYLWPMAFTFFRGKRLQILKTCCAETHSDACKPGTITDIKKESLDIQTQAGTIALIRVQLEGRRETSGFEFAIGQRIKKGERFE